MVSPTVLGRKPTVNHVFKDLWGTKPTTADTLPSPLAVRNPVMPIFPIRRLLPITQIQWEGYSPGADRWRGFVSAAGDEGASRQIDRVDRALLRSRDPRDPRGMERARKVNPARTGQTCSAIALLRRNFSRARVSVGPIEFSEMPKVRLISW